MSRTVTCDRPWLAQRAIATPEAIAIAGDGAAVTWRELASVCERVAAGLSAMGVVAGDRVAVRAATSPGLVALVHAAQSMGATIAPLAKHASPPELRELLLRLSPRLLVVDETDAAAASGIAASTPTATLESLIKSDAPTPLAERLRPNDIHCILFTSGTAARPKGVLLSHASHHAAATASCRRLDISGADRWLAAMPLNHIGGLSILLRSVIVGFSVVLRPSFETTDFDRAVRDNDVTTASLVPTMLLRWLELVEDRGVPDAFRFALLGGAATSDALIARAAAVGIRVATTYGMTETASQVTTATPHEVEEAPRSCGRALDGVEMRIHAQQDALGNAEILIRSDQVMTGYLDDDDATRLALHNGWLRTGDVGRIDASGRLFVEGRIDDLIVSGGENVSPLEVETVLESHAAVAEAAVYGVADDQWGQRVVADVVLVPNATADPAQLRTYCRGRLARYKLPREVRVVNALPRTASGKLRRSALRAPSTASRSHD